MSTSEHEASAPRGNGDRGDTRDEEGPDRRVDPLHEAEGAGRVHVAFHRRPNQWPAAKTTVSRSALESTSGPDVLKNILP